MRVPGFPKWIDVVVTKDSAHSTVHVDVSVAPPYKGIDKKTFPRMSFHPGCLTQTSKVTWSKLVKIESIALKIVAQPPTQTFDITMTASGVKDFHYHGTLSYLHGPFGEKPNPWNKVVLTHDQLREFFSRNSEKPAAGGRNATTDPKKTEVSLNNVRMMGGQSRLDAVHDTGGSLTAEERHGTGFPNLLIGFGFQLDLGGGPVSLDLATGIFESFGGPDKTRLGVFASKETQYWGMDAGVAAGVFDLVFWQTEGAEGYRTALDNLQGEGFSVGGSVGIGPLDAGLTIYKNSHRTICGCAIEAGVGVGLGAQWFKNNTKTIAVYTD